MTVNNILFALFDFLTHAGDDYNLVYSIKLYRQEKHTIDDDVNE